MNRCPFTLSSPNHNLLLTLLTQSNNTPHPWIKCHKCGKWRKLPATLSALSPLLPSLPLTLHSLTGLSAPFLPFPFTCSAVHWDLDRRICSAIQDYQDIVHEWHQVPLKLVRATARFDFYVSLAHFLRVKGVSVREYPCIYGKSVDLFALYNLVHWAGGDAVVSERGWWPAVYERLRLAGKAGQAADVDYLMEIYRSYFFEWQESKPAVFEESSEDDDSTAAVGVVAVTGEVKESKESEVVDGRKGGGGGGSDGQSGGGSVEAKEEVRVEGRRADEVKPADGKSKQEQAEVDTEVRESELMEQKEAGETSVEEIATVSSVALASGAGRQREDKEESRPVQPMDQVEVSSQADPDKQMGTAPLS